MDGTIDLGARIVQGTFIGGEAEKRKRDEQSNAKSRAFKCVDPYVKSTASVRDRVRSCKDGNVDAARGYEKVPTTRQECVNNCHTESDYRQDDLNVFPGAALLNLGNGVYQIPDGVVEIAMDAFSQNDDIEQIIIPESVTVIGPRAFEYCFYLNSVNIPSSVTEIQYYTFMSCESLTSVTIPDSVTKIGNSAFQYCTGLTSITIPDSVTKIGNDAFKDCRNLKSIYIPGSLSPQDIGYYAFPDHTTIIRRN